MMRAVIAALVGLLMVGTAAAETVGERVCARSVQAVNGLVESAFTECLVTAEGGGTVLLYATPARVMQSAAARRAFLLVVVASAGEALNRERGHDVRAVAVMDGGMAAERRVMRIGAATAARLQREVHAGAMTLEEMSAQIEREARMVAF